MIATKTAQCLLRNSRRVMIGRKATPQLNLANSVLPLSSFSQRELATTTDASKRRPRRKKVKYEKFSEAKLATRAMAITTSLVDPFEYSGDSIEEYKEKANLSPWTPVPDSVARKIFDRAEDGNENGVFDEVSSSQFSFHPIEFDKKRMNLR